MHLQVLTIEQINQIHQATLDILSQTGVELTHPGARDILQEHDAEVAGKRVLFPPALVEKSLALCPSKVILQGRDPEKRVILGQGDCYAHNVGGVPNVLEKNKRRAALRSDVTYATRLLDSLSNISTVTPHFTPQDVPPDQMTLWMFLDTVANTSKPVRAPGTHTSALIKSLAEMADIVFPELGRRGLTVGISPISPLTLPDSIAEAMMETARQNMILGPLPCPIMGATAPMSIVGAVAQQNAEVLVSIVLAQVVNPGVPVIYKGRLSMMDPYTGLSMWGNPELGLISAATVQVAHKYGLPVDVYGLSTNSHLHDIQNGYERVTSALLPVLAGADEISGVGEMDGGVNSSLAQMVLDDEILSGIIRLRKGLQVDEESLAVDLIASAIMGSGNFIAEAHTVRFLRGGEITLTELADRSGWSEWENAGRPTILGRAESKVTDLLDQAEKNQAPLSGVQLKELENLIQ